MPFYPWRYIHADHHVWTGWRDLDPTMGQLRPRELSSVARRTADFCWKAWIPVFCLTFSAGNFWNLRRLRRQWKSGKPRREFLFSILFLVMCDPLLLSQNAHIPKKSSGGVKVAPIALHAQDEYTRSLLFPRWVSKWILLYFDRHGVHHFVPNLPLYRLGVIRERVSNEIHWWTWLRTAKRMPIHRLLLESRDETGVSI